VRLLGDLDPAEEAMHEAFAAALESWPQTDIRNKRRPWVISTVRFPAIDGMSRLETFGSSSVPVLACFENMSVVWFPASSETFQ
jgi:RNA polymerase sigma-70 factor (ECF subfamily)